MSARLVAICLVAVVHASCTSTRPVRSEKEADAVFALGVRDEIAARSATGATRVSLLKRARRYYERVLQRFPRDAPTLSNHANVAYALGDRDVALRDLDKAIAVTDGPERAFYFRRAGDLTDDPVKKEQRYWHAVQWSPVDITAHERLLPFLGNAPEIQVANYFRFLLEHGRTNRVAVAAAAVAPRDERADDVAAAAAAALADVAAVISAEALESTARPFLERGGPAATELRAVMDGQSAPWTWLASHGAPTAATDAPPHASYRALTHAIGLAAAQRGEIARAERQHRLALEMPGAGAADLLELFRFLGEYGTTDDLCDVVLDQESRYASRTAEEEIAIRRAAASALALHELCGEDEGCGVRRQSLRLYALGAEPPLIAQEVCPVPPPNCPHDVQYGFSEASGGDGMLLSIPASAVDCSIDRAVLLLATDYKLEKLGPLLIEAPPAARAAAEHFREKLATAHVTAQPVRIEWRSPDGRIRLRRDSARR